MVLLLTGKFQNDWTIQTPENRKTSFGGSLFIKMTIKPEPKMIATWNSHCSKLLWSYYWLESFKMIGPPKLEKIEKTVFGTESGPIFGPDFPGEGVEMGQNRWNCGVLGPFELSENWNGFRFPLLLMEIYTIEKRYYFPKFGTFRSITWEPDFCRTCGFRQNEPTIRL